MNEKLKEYLSETNSQLLIDFKWGRDGERYFHEFMRLIREEIEPKLNCY